MLLSNNWSGFCSTYYNKNLLLQFTKYSTNRIDFEESANNNNCLDMKRRRRRKGTVKPWSTAASLRVGTDVILEISQNKALIAATVCAAIGQLAKPFAASILYQKEFDPKSVFQAGGFPSTHSSAAVATAMSVGLERGFSDSVFGLAVVFAAITMYDAQGVRREVGVHAKTLNKILATNQPNKCSSSDTNGLINSSSKKSLSSSDSNNILELEEAGPLSSILTSDKRMNSSFLTDDIGKGSESNVPISSPLKESIGHTEVEVAAGALLGLLASLAVYSL
uniref:uncharacterized membrane protein YuiD n=1 Tax=Erigeron canadensis TaxID=72917 RepID=UPI001CB8945B|nr:uncharacterized membrane protein YuiD [Erigeron canadensis]